MRVEKLTKTVVDKAKVEEGAERSIYWDKSMSGFGLVVSSGRKSFVCQYRAGRRSRRFTLGDAAKLSVEQARKQARIILGKVEMGGDPVEERRKKESAAANGFRSVCDRYLEAERRKDGKQQLRSLDHRHKMLERIWRTNAKLGARAIGEIKKSDLVQLLDDVEERARARGYDGRTMADRVLGTIRRIMNWHASRDDDFRSPIVRGMARTKPAERARERTLTDDELRTVWRAAEGTGDPFGSLVQFLLLTGARRSEAAAMARGELSGSDWILPAARNKTKRDLIRPLTPAALAVLDSLPRIGDGGLFFTADGLRPFRGFARAKRELDRRSGVTGWTLHDLRRTARSLMSRAGVPSDHAERCLGHVMPGVRGTYDRHEYHAEKKLAFEKLAAQVERIVNPQPNVIPMTRQEA